MDFFTIRVMCCNFLNLYGCYVLQYKSFLTIFSLQTQQISKISGDQKRFFIALSLYPLSFSVNTPFNAIYDLFVLLQNFFWNLLGFGLSTLVHQGHLFLYPSADLHPQSSDETPANHIKTICFQDYLFLSLKMCIYLYLK